MELLFAICAVVASLAVVTIAVVTIRVLSRVETATEEVTKLAVEARLWISEAGDLTREARETVAEVRGVIVPVRRMAERFGDLGGRTADLSAALLGEISPLLRTVVAVVGGAKAGTTLLQRLFQHFTRGRPAANGGSDNA